MIDTLLEDLKDLGGEIHWNPSSIIVEYASEQQAEHAINLVESTQFYLEYYFK
jgi:uncharacterized protein YegP (UPF0339 family)